MNEIDSVIREDANESAILSLLMYLDLQDLNLPDKVNMYKVLDSLGKFYGENASGGFDLYMENAEKYDHKRTLEDYKNSQNQYNKILNYSKQHPDFGELTMNNQSWRMEEYKADIGGLSAASFVDGNGDVNVSYRGTGSREWPDNGYAISGEYPEGSSQQKQAVEYFDKIIAPYVKAGAIVVVNGHSKGGNKAQYVTINSKYRDSITTCFNFDGQGMSIEAIDYFDDEYSDYDKSTSKIYGFFSENDFVSPLGMTIVPDNQRYYFEETLDKTGVLDTAKNHFPSDYLTEDGEFSNQTTQGYLSMAVEAITIEVMKLPPEYRSKVAGLAMDIMSKGNPEINGNAPISSEDKLIAAIVAIPILKNTLGKTPEGKATLIEIKGDIVVSVFDWIDNIVDEKEKDFQAAIKSMDNALDGMRDIALDTILSFEKEKDDIIDNAVDTVVDGAIGLDQKINNWADGVRDDALKGIQNSVDGLAEDIGNIAKFFGADHDDVNHAVNAIDGVTDIAVSGIQDVDGYIDDFRYGAIDKAIEATRWVDNKYETFKYGVIEDASDAIKYADNQLEKLGEQGLELAHKLEESFENTLYDGIEGLSGMLADVEFWKSTKMEELEKGIQNLSQTADKEIDKVFDSITQKFGFNTEDSQLKIIEGAVINSRMTLELARTNSILDLIDYVTYDNYTEASETINNMEKTINSAFDKGVTAVKDSYHSFVSEFDKFKSFVSSKFSKPKLSRGYNIRLGGNIIGGIARFSSMKMSVDLNKLRNLKNDLSSLNQTMDGQVNDIIGSSQQITSSISSKYNESYVRREIRSINSIINNIKSKERKLNQLLDSKTRALENAMQVYDYEDRKLSRIMR